MKNLLSILVVLALATTLAFSVPQVNDNSGSDKTGTGTFSCTVLTPLAIIDPSSTAIDLGDFVASSTPYVISQTMTFGITGEPNHGFYYTATATPAFTGTGSVALGTGSGWNMTGGTAILDGSGASSLEYTIDEITVSGSGSWILTLDVEVSYNTL